MPVTITLERGSYVDTYVSGLKEPHDRNNGVRGGVAKCLAYLTLSSRRFVFRMCKQILHTVTHLYSPGFSFQP